MLVLASNSPRRKQLLAFGGYSFTVVPAEIDESFRPPETPIEYVSRLAAAKARHIARLFETKSSEMAATSVATVVATVVAADTTVEIDGELLGKPVDANEAEEMLGKLQARTHKVHTALAVLKVQDRILLTDVCTTDVSMRNYTEEEIASYIATGDPFDKAGAYAIQHAGFHPVESLQGCFTNVVGLPLCRLNSLFATLMTPVPQTPFACLHSQQQQCSIPPELLSVHS